VRLITGPLRDRPRVPGMLSPIPMLKLLAPRLESLLIAFDGQVWSTGSNFGEIGNAHTRMLSSKGILVVNPRQLADRRTTTRPTPLVETGDKLRPRF
jgi:hypothetical protein